MELNQSTFDEIISSENEMILSGEKRYGAYYINALNFVIFLGDFLKSVDHDRFVFAMFLSQIKKHSTLALFSTLRLHHIQTSMDIRQVLEAGACASYAIANPESEGFAEINSEGFIDASQELMKKRYDWLDKNYPTASEHIKNMKTSINSSSAHSNIIYANNNFKYSEVDMKFEIPFFDIEDDYLVKTDLWTIGNIIMGLIDLFYGVAKNHGGLVFSDDFKSRLKNLEVENHRLKAEMMQTERYKKSSEKVG